jgi:hypothetical protein
MAVLFHAPSFDEDCEPCQSRVDSAIVRPDFSDEPANAIAAPFRVCEHTQSLR